MTVESSVLALPIFEQIFVRQVGEAMVKKIEAVILSTADGSASNRGILAETPAAGQALTYDDLDYDVLVEAEAALPQAYENGAVYCMTKKTFMAFVGMTDAEGHPIARVNYGIAGKPERVLMGRDVVLCGDYMSSFSSSLAQGTVFAFLFDFKDYLLNTVYDLGIQRRQNWDTEDYETKAVMSVDGKVIDKNSLVTLSKKS
jgi:HK97 family phage major capsid protein